MAVTKRLIGRARGPWFGALVLLLAGVALVGCGKRDPFGRQPLEGVVTWKGKPIQFGSITLEPAEGQPAGATTSISDGKFSIPRTAGPCPGKYNVWLHAYDRVGERPTDGSEGIPPKEILPPKYQTEPATQITIEKVDEENTNRFEFDIK